MENRPPPDETSITGRNPNGSSGSHPPWLWLIVIGLLALIFWHFVPKREVEVPYHPWFTEQVNKGNIRSISIQGTQIRVELAEAASYSPPSGATLLVKKFTTYAPTQSMMGPILEKVEKAKRGAVNGTTNREEQSPQVEAKKNGGPPGSP